MHSVWCHSKKKKKKRSKGKNLHEATQTNKAIEVVFSGGFGVPRLVSSFTIGSWLRKVGNCSVINTLECEGLVFAFLFSCFKRVLEGCLATELRNLVSMWVFECWEILLVNQHFILAILLGILVCICCCQRWWLAGPSVMYRRSYLISVQAKRMSTTERS